MDNDAIAYLEKRAVDYHIDVDWTDDLNPFTPPACSVLTRKILMNRSWHAPVSVAFQLAHEMSHIINGDDSDFVFYNASFTGKQSVEYKANVGAVKLLVPYYYQDVEKENANVYDFINQFDVPSFLAGVVREQTKEYYVGNQFLSKH